jgi:hypothetical protein
MDDLKSIESWSAIRSEQFSWLIKKPASPNHNKIIVFNFTNGQIIRKFSILKSTIDMTKSLLNCTCLDFQFLDWYRILKLCLLNIRTISILLVFHCFLGKFSNDIFITENYDLQNHGVDFCLRKSLLWADGLWFYWCMFLWWIRIMDVLLIGFGI